MRVVRNKLVKNLDQIKKRCFEKLSNSNSDSKSILIQNLNVNEKIRKTTHI